MVMNEIKVICYLIIALAVLLLKCVVKIEILNKRIARLEMMQNQER